MKLSEKEKENALNEVRILASIEHPNIAGYKEAFFEESTSSLCIVMEYADGGDLLSKINSLKKEGKHMKEEDVWSIFYQMVVGLQALHKVKIVHRDIKCANVFLTKEGFVKLGDLNVSKIAKMGVLKTQTGTPYYASPEVWQDKPYDKRSDIWSLGCVLYELIALHPPFEAKDMQGLYKKVLTGVYPKIPSSYSSDLNAMLKALLQVEPKNRPTTKQIMHLPVFIGKYNEIRENKAKDFEDEHTYDDQNMLLGTIKVPKNLRLLSERLPKSNYEKKQKKEEDKMSEKGNKSVIQDQLHSIQEEEVPSGQKQQIPEDSKIKEYASKPPIVRNGKAGSQRSLSAKQNQNGIVQNQLAEKGQQIMQKHRQISSDRAQGEESTGSKLGRIGQSNINSQERNNQLNQQIQNDAYIKVQQYRKKLYINQLPKSSPSQRNGIADLYYQIAHGKGALIDKHEQKLSKERIVNPQPFEKVVSEIQSHQSVQGPVIQQVHRQDSRQNNHRQLVVEDPLRGNNRIAQQPLPLINAGRQAMNENYTPKYHVPLEKLYGKHNQALISPQQRESNHKLGMPPMMPRTKSKDSLLIYNNLRDVYRNMGGGAQSIVQAGRLESQRLLLDHYKRVDPNNHQIVPIDLKRQNLKHQYIPMSQHGQRGIISTNNGAGMPIPQSRQNMPLASPSQQSVRPQWWG
ncbi:protein kinase domain containing protein [Stylonychia lemnae]|uniref:non-specific serine/threonine protein kinase n=1 Tax=Stylonychia lemnae TaxID=5949 RepID=A0A078ATM2_STYLE|nr:protein kinase domain containing protein [Stylonychia lemnae]|eukprot:CDW84557.1 protein kinase domain containing protein [Stylonychia lemnae]